MNANTPGTRRTGWLIIGSAMVLALVLWAWGTLGNNEMDTTVGETSDMAMPGMDMGMGGGNSAAVHLTPAQVRQFGVTFATVEERTLEHEIRAVGVIEADETRLVDVTTKFSGYVERLYADFLGRYIEAGSSLLDIYSPELVSAQEELLFARRLRQSVGSPSIPGIDGGPVDLEAAARRRLSLWDISADQISGLLATGEPSRTLSLRSPISGVILEKSVVEGAAFETGQTLFRLADLSSVWVSVEVRESDAALVAPGSRAMATLAAYPGDSIPGVVDFVYPTVDERTRSVRARVVLHNASGRLRPGMFASIRLATPNVRALSVPTDAVVWTGDRTLLFVEEEGGGIRPVETEVGATIGDYTIVRSGVAATQRVVGSAQYLIDAEANIGAIMRSMMGMMGAGDMSGMEMGDMSGMDMSGMDTPGVDEMDGMEMPGDSGSMTPNPSGR